MKIIYTSRFYQVCVTRPETESRGTILFFETLGEKDPETGLAKYRSVPKENFLTEAGFTGVFIQTSRRDWFQDETFMDAMYAILCEDALPRPWMTYGTSMGGYGAICAMPELDANFFLVGSAQASINNTYLSKIKDPRWRQDRAYFRTDPILDGTCKSSKGIVLCDQVHVLDQKHKISIVRNTSAAEITTHGTGHFSMSRVTREFGFKTFANEVFDVMENAQKSDQFVRRIQDVFDSCLAGQFAVGSLAKRQQLYEEFGGEKIVTDYQVSALIDELLRQPSEGYARLLASLLKHVKSEKDKRFIVDAITECDLDYILQ